MPECTYALLYLFACENKTVSTPWTFISSLYPEPNSSTKQVAATASPVEEEEEFDWQIEQQLPQSDEEEVDYCLSVLSVMIPQ